MEVGAGNPAHPPVCAAPRAEVPRQLWGYNPIRRTFDALGHERDMVIDLPCTIVGAGKPMHLYPYNGCTAQEWVLWCW
jgi:hypothetical protein